MIRKIAQEHPERRPLSIIENVRSGMSGTAMAMLGRVNLIFAVIYVSK